MTRFTRLTVLFTAFTMLGTLYLPAHAEKADKDKPAVIDSDRATSNEITQTRVFDGNVVITKGTMVIKADRVEMKVDVEGYQTMVATSAAGNPATFKQKREGLDETIEAEALRLDFDGKADTIVLTDKSIVRRLAKGVLQDETKAKVIKYFNQTNFYDVTGGYDEKSGQQRLILAPRSTTPVPASK